MSAITAALTFVRGFGPQTLIILAIGAAMGSTGGWLVARGVYVGQVAHAEKAFSDLKVDTANAAFDQEKRVSGAIADAWKMQQRLDDEQRARVTTALATFSAAGATNAQNMAALTSSIKELQRDPQFACRDLPLPELYLDSLRRPAQEAGRAPDNADHP